MVAVKANPSDKRAINVNRIMVVRWLVLTKPSTKYKKKKKYQHNQKVKVKFNRMPCLYC